MAHEELRKLLDKGDYIKIARMTGYSGDLTNGRVYVYKVLSGRISGKKGKAKEILAAARVIAKRNTISGKSGDQ